MHKTAAAALPVLFRPRQRAAAGPNGTHKVSGSLQPGHYQANVNAFAQQVREQRLKLKQAAVKAETELDRLTGLLQREQALQVLDPVSCCFILYKVTTKGQLHAFCTIVLDACKLCSLKASETNSKFGSWMHNILQIFVIPLELPSGISICHWAVAGRQSVIAHATAEIFCTLQICSLSCVIFCAGQCEQRLDQIGRQRGSPCWQVGTAAR